MNLRFHSCALLVAAFLVAFALSATAGAQDADQNNIHIDHRFTNTDAQSLIGLPLGSHKTIVDKRGDLKWSQWSVKRKPLDTPIGFSSQMDGDLAIDSFVSAGAILAPLTMQSQTLYHERDPFIVTKLATGGVHLEELAFAADPDAKPGELPQAASGSRGVDVVRLTFSNDGVQPASIILMLSGRERNLPGHVQGNALVTNGGEDVALLTDVAGATAPRAEDNGLALAVPFALAAHAAKTLWIRLPYEWPTRAMEVAGQMDAARRSVEHAFHIQMDDGEWDGPPTSAAIPEDFTGLSYESAQLANLLAASRKSCAELRSRHIADHQRLFRRAEIKLSATSDATAADPNAHLPTDVRMRRIKDGGEDVSFLPIYFQYGRCLLIGSSRPGTMAANLQGIWNESVDPPWGSKYTVNINTEMNYWIAERANLAALHAPLFDLIDTTTGPGSATAKKYYGAGGYVVHHNTDIRGDSAPIDGLGGGIWAMGAAWLSLHLWDHYDYGGDKQFLAARAYPRLREVATFLLDYMVASPDGQLVTGPSCSPENKYRLPDGTTANLCMGPTMDIAITRAVLARAIQAATLLGLDADLRGRA